MGACINNELCFVTLKISYQWDFFDLRNWIPHYEDLTRRFVRWICYFIFSWETLTLGFVVKWSPLKEQYLSGDSLVCWEVLDQEAYRCYCPSGMTMCYLSWGLWTSLFSTLWISSALSCLPLNIFKRVSSLSSFAKDSSYLRAFCSSV